MNCTICMTGELKPGKANIPFERDGRVVMIKEVPALVCDNCGEPVFEDEVAAQLLEIVEQVLETGVEIAIRSFEPALPKLEIKMG